jgi:hypothetical protein
MNVVQLPYFDEEQFILNRIFEIYLSQKKRRRISFGKALIK